MKKILYVNLIGWCLLGGCNQPAAVPQTDPDNQIQPIPSSAIPPSSYPSSSPAERFTLPPHPPVSITESGDCHLSDGEYEADVSYYNPATGFSNIYTLEVDVEDCNVTQINFPKGGYLGPHHIDPSAIDEDGDATVTDDQNREFSIHIDNDNTEDNESDEPTETETDEDNTD